MSTKDGRSYRVRQPLRGFDELVDLDRGYAASFARLALPKLAICNEGDRQAHYRDVLAFLGLLLVSPLRDER